jgi:protein SCO1/2
MRLPPFKFSLIAASVLVITFLAGGLLFLSSQGDDSIPRLIPDQAMTAFVAPKPLKEFSLVDQHNNPFDLKRLKGRWSFLFFGFTHCPDICPSTLASLSKLREQLTKGVNGSKNVQFVFISVDPKRDTAVTLKQYTSYFDPSIIGVTGTEVELRNLTQQLGAQFEVEASQDSNNYQVYHTSTIFLINPQGQYAALLTPPFDISTISRRFKVLTKINAMNSQL